MATIADLWVGLGLRSGPFSSGLDKAERDLDSFTNKVAAAGKKMVGAGQMLTLGITTPLAAFGASAVMAASDQAEAMSAVQTVYGDAAKQIKGFSGSVATSLGLSRAEALSAASGFGVFAQGAGLTGEAMADFSNESLQAAADLASFYNAPVPEALAAIQSGLTGESEPLRRFGILLSDANIQQYALANGLWDGTGAMTEQQKVLARQGYIMDNLGAAQGDFIRTSGGVANSMRIAKAEFKDASAVLGGVLLPYVTKGIHFLSALITKVQNLSPQMQKWVVVIAAAAAALGPLLMVVGTLATVLNPVGLTILGIVAAITLLGIAYKTNFLGFADAVDKVIPVLQAFIQYIRFVVADGDIMNDWLTHLPKPLQVVAKFLGRLINAFRKIGEAIAVGNWRKALAGLGDALSAPAKALGDFFKSINTGFAPLDKVLHDIGKLFTDFGRLVQEVFQGDWRGALAVGERLLRHFWEFVQEGLALAVELFKRAGLLIEHAITALVQKLFGIDLTGFFAGFNTAVGVVFDGLKAALGWLTGTAIPAIANFAQTAAGWISGTFWPALQTIGGAVASFLAPFASWLIDTGIPAVELFAGTVYTWISDTAIPGLQNLYNAIADYLQPVIDWAINTGIPGIENFARIVQQAGIDARNALGDIWDWAQPKLSTLYSWFVNFVGQLSGWVSSIAGYAGDIWGALKGIWDKAQGPLYSVVNAFDLIRSGAANLASTIGAIVQPIIDAFDSISEHIPDLPEWLDPGNLDWTPGKAMGKKPLPDALTGGAMAIPVTATADQMAEPFNQAAILIQVAFNRITGFAADARAAVANAFVGLRGDLRAINVTIEELLLSQMSGWVIDATQRGSQIRAAVANEFVGLRNDLAVIMSGVSATVTGSLYALAGAAASAGYSVGSAIGSGIYNGMSAWIGPIASMAATLVNNAESAARLAADAHSPSRLFMALGEDLVAGLMAPLERADPALAWAANAPDMAGYGGGVGGITVNNTFNAPIYGVDDLENTVTGVFVEKIAPAMAQARANRDRALGVRP